MIGVVRNGDGDRGGERWMEKLTKRNLPVLVL